MILVSLGITRPLGISGATVGKVDQMRSRTTGASRSTASMMPRLLVPVRHHENCLDRNFFMGIRRLAISHEVGQHELNKFLWALASCKIRLTVRRAITA